MGLGVASAPAPPIGARSQECEFRQMRNLRTYLAGLGSGGAMLGAAVAAFIALGAIVGFDGLPSSSADSDSSAILVQSNAPEIAAANSVGPAAAPAAVAAAGAGAAAAGTGGGATGGPGAVNNGGNTNNGDTTGDDSGLPPPTPPAGGDNGPPDDGGGGEPIDPPPTPAPSSGPVGNAVDQVDGAVQDTTGLDLDLGGKTGAVTGAVDGVVGGLTGGQNLGLDDVKLPTLPNVVDLTP
jgi:hypothetical protein